MSLLNVDYIICSKSLANRLSKVLSSLIKEDQTCSVPGRTIFENLALFRDILDHVNITNETSILVQAHIKFQYKLPKLRNTVYYFPFDWCIAEAIAKLTTDLVFTL